jgi:hypothetical protein
VDVCCSFTPQSALDTTGQCLATCHIAKVGMVARIEIGNNVIYSDLYVM